MALISCPECGRENISDSAKYCPNCGYPIASQKQPQHIPQTSYPRNAHRTNRTPFIIVICCLALVSGIVYTSTRCEIDGCFNAKSSSSSRGYCSYHQNAIDRAAAYNNYNTYSQASRKDSGDLKISDVRVTTNSVSTYCTGTISNDGDDTFKFVQVKGAFKNWDGDVIETGNNYAVGAEGLAPGESTSFTIYCDKNSNVCTCDVTIYDYD